MASKEEIQKQNLEESNKLLAEQINLVTNIQDKMSALVKSYKEKGNLDKASLDIVNQTIKQIRNLSSEYDSIKNVQKDIAKNAKNQNDIQKQMMALQQRGGQELKDELKNLKDKENNVKKAEQALAKFVKKQQESKSMFGANNKKADELVSRAQAALEIQQKSLDKSRGALTPVAEQVLLLEEANEAQKQAAEHLAEQLRRQENLAKSQS